MSDTLVQLEVTGQIATVTLHRPSKHNALDMPMFIAIDQMIRQISKEPSIRVVIVRGEGPSFCSGLDIKGILASKTDPLKLLWKWWPGQSNLAQRVTIGWRKLKVPVIMVLHGKCWGGGMQMALGGDFRIAAPDTSLSIMEARWGLIPDMGGTVALQSCVGVDQAMKLAMTAEIVNAEKALNMGLVTDVAEQPYEQALSLARELVQRSPDTNQLIKRCYHKWWSTGERSILAGETFSQWKILLGKNQKIAVKRQLGKGDTPYQ